MKEHQKKKTALIAGGSRGIGKEIANQLAEKAIDTIFINYVENDDAANQTRLLLEEKGVTVHLLKYNMAFPMEIKAMFAEISNTTKHLDYFVHCTALTAFKPLHKVRSNQWDLTMNISARSLLQCAQACIPLMENGGKIVAISSTGSQRFNPNYGSLGVAKATLESIVKYLAVELSENNIQVNSVVGGLIQGDKLPQFPAIERVIEETLKRTPARRLGKPADIAKAVLFLLTQAEWIYGQNIIVDGGYCLT